MQQEEDAKGGGSSSSKRPSSPGNNDSQISYDEDELIDMDDCPSDEESDLGWVTQNMVYITYLPMVKVQWFSRSD